MRLRHLELHGYKTFATRTGFVFDAGITAIVGPNGSGKSNIADAIRWVLGEQSYRALRGKRTEDMIFSGSLQRSRLGMASATLLFDNQDGWLPIDFGEVALTRRAYRSGENEYLINGRRVRLSDIIDLLSKSGLAHRTYAVIGQGLVDAVLSLRPEDRRALFEEAAGIAAYRAKRSEALARLDETRANLVRVHDIVNEIGPRLHRLEREAERARLLSLLRQQLETLLKELYGYRWHQAQIELHRVRDAVARREARVQRQREALRAVENSLSACRAGQSQLRDRLGGWHQESAQLHRQMEEVQRDLAVQQERARLMAIQRSDLDAELRELELRLEVAAEEERLAQEDEAALLRLLAEKEAALQQAQGELESLEARRAELGRALSAAQARVYDLGIEMATCQSRLSQVAERQASTLDQKVSHLNAIAEVQRKLELLGTEIELAMAKRADLVLEGGKLAAELARLDTALAANQKLQSELRSAVGALQMTVHRLESQYDLLTRLQHEGEGLPAGVRAVLQAASPSPLSGSSQARQDGQPEAGLTGIIGTVASLFRVRQEHEAVVEAALGTHLQDIVVESWNEAEAAIAFLAAGARGRARFLPLDLVQQAAPLEAPDEPGVVGIAADLVSVEPKLAGARDALLGRTLVVESLGAARRVSRTLQGPFQIVTLGGEVLHSTGTVAGGRAPAKEGAGLLARERELRDVAARLESDRQKLGQLEAALEEAGAAERQLQCERESLARQHQHHTEAFQAVDAELARLQREADGARQELALRQGWVDDLDKQAVEFDAERSTLAADVARLQREKDEAHAQATCLQAELEALRGEALYQSLSEARTSAALAQRNLEHRRALQEAMRKQRSARETELNAKRQRMAELGDEQAVLAGQIEAGLSRQAVVQGWLAALEQKLAPAEAEIARLEAERERLASDEATLRAQLRAAEESLAQAQLARSRHEDRRQRLRRQIIDDFGLVEMEPTEDQPEQPPLPLAELVSTLPVVEELPKGLEEEIQQLRAQIRRMGSVSPTVLEEYAEVRDRHAFLTSQAADLEEAARRLNDVIAELDQVMEREFLSTFERVAAAFQENFARLFGGGTARLVLTDPDEPATTGVDILARPPGKRQQTLAMLSGGERALTAVALVFAFLQTNPPPFCILDEVDAMLDEANVQRFRQMLEELAQQTQFIVITHNRTTIEAANIIYGVSMGEDSASQVVSLRLDGDRIVTAAGRQIDLRT